MPAGAASGVADAGLLDFDDVGAEPREHLGAGGAGFELGEVYDADVVQGFLHGGVSLFGGMVSVY